MWSAFVRKTGAKIAEPRVAATNMVHAAAGIAGTAGRVALVASANAHVASTARSTASTVDSDWPGSRRIGLSVSNGAASARTITPNEATTAPRERATGVST